MIRFDFETAVLMVTVVPVLITIAALVMRWFFGFAVPYGVALLPSAVLGFCALIFAVWFFVLSKMAGG